jgi:hypothetical protein
MDQEVKYIKIKNLVLWTENPRDSIDANATDQEIVNKALDDKLLKWNLAKLAKEMGSYYDLSELPTVVYHDGKPVVYDGNRRIILGKIKHGLVIAPKMTHVQIPSFPEDIPCNVCSEEIALKNVYRKHSDTGSWLPLERDMFVHKFMNEKKSVFLILDEITGIISSNPHLNQVFVRDEIFKEENLNLMGFTVQDGTLNSRHTSEESFSILSDISKKVEGKEITTRKSRGKVIEVLDPYSQKLIESNKKNESRPFNGAEDIIKSDLRKKPKQSKRKDKKETEIFGGKLYLRMGDVSNLYRDIVDLHQFYIDNKDKLSSSFTSLIRMSLRLLCEAAVKDQGTNLEKYIKENFDDAKSSLSQDVKTTLSSQNVSKDTVVQLLHTGAHNYQSSSNMEQTIAVSIIVGAILTISHGQR